MAALTEASTSPPEVAASGRRLPYLDGIRALAALAVLFYHVSGDRLWVRSGNALGLDGASWASRAGGYGVAVFFLLSGYLLYRPFVRAHLAGRPRPGTGRFLVARAARIYPAYWVALTVSLVAGLGSTVPQERAWSDYPALYLLVQTYVVPDFDAGLSVAWTLCVEVGFSLLLPLIAVAIVRLPGGRSPSRSERAQTQLAGLVLLSLVSLAYRFVLLFTDHRLPGQPANWVLNYLDWFAVGMALALAAAWRDAGGPLPRWLEGLADRPLLSWAFALQLYWLTVQLRIPLDFTPAEDGQTLLLFPLTGASAALLLIPATLGSRRRAMRFLDAPALVFIGSVSYGIYLWHLPVLRQWTETLDDLHFLPTLGFVVAVSTLVAWASHVLVERPALRWRRAWERRRPVTERG